MGREAEPQFFDSANIAESYTGIVLPLTYSYAEFAYEHAYRALLASSGVGRKTLDRHAAAFKTLLGLFYGRMYYCMNSWYRMTALVPGYSRNKANFELMISSNIKEPVSFDIRPSALLRLAYPFIALGKVLRFRSIAARFRSAVTADIARLSALKFETLDYAACLELCGELERCFLARWYVTIENDFLVQTYLGLANSLIGEERLPHYLRFTSMATKQTGALARLSSAAQEHKAVWNAVLADDAPAFEQALEGAPAFRAQFEEYLGTFGGRLANELKLETVGLEEDRTKLFGTLRAYRAYAAPGTGEEIPLPRLPLGKRMLARFALRSFKEHAARREDFRLLRSATFSIARRLFKRMGALLAESGAIALADDVFYLTLGEITDAGAAKQRFADAVAARKAEYAGFAKIMPATHFMTTDGRPPEPAALEKASGLAARPASPGKVAGSVRVFKEYSMPSAIDFDILVTSHTDPGWTALIALSKGLIIEHGGMLSHASVAARELGIPAVIGALGATDTLRDGQRVLIDGTKGTVRILD